MKTEQKWKIGNCLDLLPEIPDKSVDLVITSPPYNFNGFRRDRVESKYGLYSDNLPEPEYRSWIMRVFKEIDRILKPTGTFYLNIKGKWVDYNYEHPYWVLTNPYFKLLNDIIWHFPSGADVAKIKWYPRHEHIFMFIKGKGYYFNGEYAKLEDVWDINHVVNGCLEETSHPAQYPIKLVEIMIKASSKEGDVVLDPFVGSGTTLEACMNLNRNCIGFEIDPQWEPIYRKRLKLDNTKLDAFNTSACPKSISPD